VPRVVSGAIGAVAALSSTGVMASSLGLDPSNAKPAALALGAVAGAAMGATALGAAAGGAIGYGAGAATGLVACEGGKAIDFLKDKLGHLSSPSTPSVAVTNAKGKGNGPSV
jgi:hypothetical protein